MDVIEWAPFTLKQGVSEAALAQAAKLIQSEFLSRQEGFVRRELVKEAEGKYVDVIWWTNFATAEAAMAKAETSPACASYFELIHINPDDMQAGIKHLQVIARYEQ
jgi:hypothetical protein